MDTRSRGRRASAWTPESLIAATPEPAAASIFEEPASMSPSLLAVLLYAALTLLLLISIAAMRARLVITRQRAADAFTPAGDDVSPFSGRLCRAHANCCENLPVFGALVATAVLSSHSDITDPTALWVLAARAGQTVTHLGSGRRRAIRLRFLFMLVQIAMQTMWVVHLLRVSVQ